METYLVAFLVFAAVMVGMAVGVIFSNRRIQGSCGGLSAWKDELGRPMCEACADCPAKKEECELEAKEHSASEGRSAATAKPGSPAG